MLYRFECKPLRNVGIPQLVMRDECAARPVDDGSSFGGGHVADQVGECTRRGVGERGIVGVGVFPRRCVTADVEGAAPGE
jgi:hypothetical protein